MKFWLPVGIFLNLAALSWIGAAMRAPNGRFALQEDKQNYEVTIIDTQTGFHYPLFDIFNPETKQYIGLGSPTDPGSYFALTRK